MATQQQHDFDLTLNSSVARALNPENKAEDFTVFFNPPIYLDKRGGYRAGLARLSMYFSIQNIAAEYNNNTFKYRKKGASDWIAVTLPDGLYQYSPLNETIREHTGVVDSSTENSPYIFNLYFSTTFTRVFFEIHADYEVDLREGDFNVIIGFDKRILDRAVNKSDRSPNLSRGIESFYIHCDLVNRIHRDAASNVIYTVPLSDKTATHPFVIHPLPIAWIPITRDVIDTVTVRVTDAFNNPLNLHGQDVDLFLFVQKIY